MTTFIYSRHYLIIKTIKSHHIKAYIPSEHLPSQSFPKRVTNSFPEPLLLGSGKEKERSGSDVEALCYLQR